MKVDFGTPKARRRRSQRVITKVIKITLQDEELTRTRTERIKDLKEKIGEFLEQRRNKRPFVSKLAEKLKKIYG